jgi:hypothetical protein
MNDSGKLTLCGFSPPLAKMPRKLAFAKITGEDAKRFRLYG